MDVMVSRTLDALLPKFAGLEDNTKNKFNDKSIFLIMSKVEGDFQHPPQGSTPLSDSVARCS